MENRNIPVISFSEGSFTKPIPGIHRIGIHIATTFVAMIVYTQDNEHICALQVIERQSELQAFDNQAAMDLLNGIPLNHEWLSEQEIPATILVPGNGLSLIPMEMFELYRKEYLLEPQYQLQAQDIVVNSELKNFPVMAVCAIPWSWNQQLKSLFPGAKIVHEDICWIDLMLGLKDKKSGSRVLVLNIDKHYVRILGVSENTLLFYNRYYYENQTDILYYLQLLIEKNKIDPVSFNIYLAGTGGSGQELEDSLGQYSLNVSHLNLPSFTSLPAEIRRSTPAIYFSLFSVASCG